VLWILRIQAKEVVVALRTAFPRISDTGKGGRRKIEMYQEKKTKTKQVQILAYAHALK